MTALAGLTVNGVAEVLDVDGAETLAEALRRELRLFSVREACGIGVSHVAPPSGDARSA